MMSTYLGRSESQLDGLVRKSISDVHFKVTSASTICRPEWLRPEQRCHVAGWDHDIAGQ